MEALMARKFQFISALLLLLPLVVNPTTAASTYRQDTGGITGIVSDEQGGVIPGASVQIKRGNVVVRTIVTNANGRYLASDLPPGIYDVVTSLSGFKTDTRSGV